MTTTPLLSVCVPVCVFTFSLLLQWMLGPLHWNALSTVEEMVLVPSMFAPALRASGFGSDSASIYGTVHGTAWHRLLLYHTLAPSLFVLISMPACLFLSFFPSDCHLDFLQTCWKEWNAPFLPLGSWVVLCCFVIVLCSFTEIQLYGWCMQNTWQ